MKFQRAVVLTALVGIFGNTFAEGPDPVEFEKVEWQNATVGDMAFMDAYVGDFRSQTYTAQGSGKEFFFTIRYEWYNTARTVIKWTIDMHVPADGVVRRNGEGFYAFDPFENRIMVTGFFPGRPVTSKGWISDFDVETGFRVVRIMAMAPDGQVTQIRDTFRIVDADTWVNATFISTNGGEWQAMPPGNYTRFQPADD